MARSPRFKREVMHWRDAAIHRFEHQKHQRMKRLIEQNREAREAQAAARLAEINSRSYILFDTSIPTAVPLYEDGAPDPDDIHDFAKTPFTGHLGNLPDLHIVWDRKPEIPEHN